MTAAYFAAFFALLYAAHPFGDYWVQTDHQARHKGDPDRTGEGRGACLMHVGTYVSTQALALSLAGLLGIPFPGMLAMGAALAVSGVTHYWADRRWTLAWLASILPGKSNFYRLGAPRPGRDDNPTLGTGSWALDQSFHLVFSVLFPALILALAA